MRYIFSILCAFIPTLIACELGINPTTLPTPFFLIYFLTSAMMGFVALILATHIKSSISPSKTLLILLVAAISLSSCRTYYAGYGKGQAKHRTCGQRNANS